MLILTRRKGQAAMLSNGIVVRFLQKGKDGSIRLGFDAPADVDIWREELEDKLEYKILS